MDLVYSLDSFKVDMNMVKFNYAFGLSILIAVVLISGCLNLNEVIKEKPIYKTPDQRITPIQTPAPTQKNTIKTTISTPTPIENQRSSMSSTEFYDAMRSNDLTTVQKENLYVNKIFSWTGKITNVEQDRVALQIEYCYAIQYSTTCNQNVVYLYIDDDQKPKLSSLSKGSIIFFEGRIKEIGYYGMLRMYNGTIID